VFVALHFLLINGGHYFQNHLRATFFRMSDVLKARARAISPDLILSPMAHKSTDRALFSSSALW
jgi:hypothetical protein